MVPPEGAGNPHPGAAEPARKYNFRLVDVPKLDLSTAKGPVFKNWLLDWKGYLMYSALDKEEKALQAFVLLRGLAEDTAIIARNSGLTDAELDDPAHIIRVLTEYVESETNHLMGRWYMSIRKQERGRPSRTSPSPCGSWPRRASTAGPNALAPPSSSNWPSGSRTRRPERRSSRPPTSPYCVYDSIM